MKYQLIVSKTPDKPMKYVIWSHNFPLSITTNNIKRGVENYKIILNERRKVFNSPKLRNLYHVSEWLKEWRQKRWRHYRVATREIIDV